jgi:hypothetical protein
MTRRHWAILLLVGVVAACSTGRAGTAADAADGALRAAASELVAPGDVRAGLLTESDADAWIAATAARLEGWYDGEPLASHIRGVRNVVNDHVVHPGAIISSVEVIALDLGPAHVRGGTEVAFPQAVIRYRTHRSSDPPGALGTDGVTMCDLTVTLLGGDRWRVTQEACNVSGA